MCVQGDSPSPGRKRHKTVNQVCTTVVFLYGGTSMCHLSPIECMCCVHSISCVYVQGDSPSSGLKWSYTVDEVCVTVVLFEVWATVVCMFFCLFCGLFNVCVFCTGFRLPRSGL